MSGDYLELKSSVVCCLDQFFVEYFIQSTTNFVTKNRFEKRVDLFEIILCKVPCEALGFYSRLD